MRLEVSQPVLDSMDIAKIRSIEPTPAASSDAYELSICYPGAWGKEGIESAPGVAVRGKAVDAVKSGYNILIVSDRKLDADRWRSRRCWPPRPIHQHLVARACAPHRPGGRNRLGRAKTHHFALLAGYGAEAIHPYLAMDTLAEMAEGPAGRPVGREGDLQLHQGGRQGPLKVMSKMGISTYMSYCGAQIFEAVGLSGELVDKYFKGTASKVEGIGLFEVAEEALRLHARLRRRPAAANSSTRAANTPSASAAKSHMWTPDAIAKLQHATRSNSYQTYKEYAH